MIDRRVQQDTPTKVDPNKRTLVEDRGMYVHNIWHGTEEECLRLKKTMERDNPEYQYFLTPFTGA